MKQFFLALLLIASPAFAANKVQEIKTPGGFTVWLVEEHSLPIVTANISFTGSGFAYDPPGKEGRTNLTASLLLEGAGEQRSQAFNAALEEYAIRLSIGGDDDRMHVALESLTEHKEKAFSMLADALIHPRFDTDAISRARGKVQALLVEQSESPYYKMAKAWQENIYGNHPYARIGMGNSKSVANLGEKDFKAYVARYLTKENIIISVVGDITPEGVTTLVDKNLSALPARYTPDSKLADAVIPQAPETVVVKHDIPQAMVRFGLEGIPRTDPDYITAYVINYILGGNGLSSRLGSEIRVKRGLAYSVYTQLDPKAHAALWRGMFSTRNAEVKTALATLREMLATYAKDGPTQAELDAAKAYLTGSFVLELSSNQDVANFLTIMQLYQLGSDYLEKRNSMIEKVSLADIKRVSNRFMDPARLRVVVVGQPE